MVRGLDDRKEIPLLGLDRRARGVKSVSCTSHASEGLSIGNRISQAMVREGAFPSHFLDSEKCDGLAGRSTGLRFRRPRCAGMALDVSRHPGVWILGFALAADITCCAPSMCGLRPVWLSAAQFSGRNGSCWLRSLGWGCGFLLCRILVCLSSRLPTRFLLRVPILSYLKAMLMAVRQCRGPLACVERRCIRLLPRQRSHRLAVWCWSFYILVI